MTKNLFKLQYLEWLRDSEKECIFCNPFRLLILHETKNFYVILAVGPIVEGYSLICSKLHFPCLGDLYLDLVDEFCGLKDLVRSVLTEVYGGCIFYEHGNVGTCIKHVIDNRLNHCYHAHLHCVPGNMDIFPMIQERSAKYIQISHFKDLLYFRQLDYTGHPYFYYQNQSGNQYVFPIHPQAKVPSQFLRKCVAKVVEKPHRYNWLKYPDWKKVENASNKLSKKFQ